MGRLEVVKAAHIGHFKASREKSSRRVESGDGWVRVDEFARDNGRGAVVKVADASVSEAELDDVLQDSDGVWKLGPFVKSLVSRRPLELQLGWRWQSFHFCWIGSRVSGQWPAVWVRILSTVA